MPATNKPLDINRDALQQVLTLPNSRPFADWCVACGASSGLSPELPSVVAQELSRNSELLTSLIHPNFVSELATNLSRPDLNANWCIGCGASKGSSPMDMVSNPISDLSDAEIDKIAARVRLG